MLFLALHCGVLCQENSVETAKDLNLYLSLVKTSTRSSVGTADVYPYYPQYKLTPSLTSPSENSYDNLVDSEPLYIRCKDSYRNDMYNLLLESKNVNFLGPDSVGGAMQNKKPKTPQNLSNVFKIDTRQLTPSVRRREVKITGLITYTETERDETQGQRRREEERV